MVVCGLFSTRKIEGLLEIYVPIVLGIHNAVGNCKAALQFSSVALQYCFFLQRFIVKRWSTGVGNHLVVFGSQKVPTLEDK